MIWVTDETGDTTYLNVPWHRFTGQTEPQALGHGWLQTVHPDDRGGIGRRFLEAVGARRPITVEYRLRRHDGEYRWAIDTAAPRFAPDGRFLGYIGTVMDITDRRLAEAALADSEARFRAIAEQAEAGIALTDLQGRFEFVNGRYCELLGRPREAMVGATVEQLTHPDDWPRNRELFARAAAGGPAFVIEKRYLRGDGTTFWARNTVSAIRGPDGRPSRILAVSIDVSDRVRAEEALREADRRKDEFLAMLAHELRNPLAPLTNAHRLLERTQTLDELGRSTLAMAQRQTRQMQRLVDDLLEVGRITRGVIALRPEWIELGSVVHPSVASLAGEIEARRHRIRVVLPSAPLRLRADPVRLAQILENLLHNACKYPPDGGSIRVEAEARGNLLELRVVDDGIGIDPAKRPRLFELFQQLDATLDRAHGGLGIGLALVRRLADLHGGSVDALNPGPGRGSTFVLRLPLEGPPAD